MKKITSFMLTAALALLSAFCFLPSALLGQTAVFYVPNTTQVIPSGATAVVFGAVLVGTSGSPQSVTLTNTGSANLANISISFTGTNSADFSQATTPATNCGTPLAPAASCTITVTFTPASSGFRSATLSISDNATGSPQTLGITGWGMVNQTVGFLNIANASATGTTLWTLTKLTGAPSTAVIAGTSDNKSGGIVGVTVAGAGTSGFATVQKLGQTQCVFDGSTTADDFVTVSTGTGGDCTDNASTLPADGSQVIGQVLTTNSGGGTYPIILTSIGVPGGATAATGAAFTSAPTPSSAGGVALGTALLAFSGAYFGDSAAGHSSQLTGSFTGHRVFTLPDATITIPGTILTDCGSSKSCAGPTTRSSTMKIAIGTGAAVAGSLALTGISPAFTSASSYTCTAADPSSAYYMTFVNGTGAATTGTSSTANTDTWSWVCVGY